MVYNKWENVTRNAQTGFWEALQIGTDKSASVYECGRFTCTIKHLGQMPPKHVAGLPTQVVNDKRTLSFCINGAAFLQVERNGSGEHLVVVVDQFPTAVNSHSNPVTGFPVHTKLESSEFVR